MNAEIIAVGSEMLTPDKVDTNSLFLTQELNTLGIEVVAKSIIGDDRQRLTAAVAGALSRSELVLVTGGLGPTEDDVTRDAVAAALGVGQHFEEEVWQGILQRFARFGRTPTDNNRRQAMVLDGSEILPNPNGTAPGLWFHATDETRQAGKVVALLPGPPRELKPMVADQLVPRLQKLLPPMVIRTRWYRVANMPESELDAKIAPVYTKYTNPATTVLASPGDIHIHLRARCASEAEAEGLLAEVGEPIEAILGKHIYSNNGLSLEAALGELLRQRQATVATAESITAGGIGAKLTQTSGSSDYFAGGFLVYSNQMKQSLLEIPEAMLAEHTAVSDPVARAMAEAARQRTGATYGLSATGYADGDQAGTVWLGLATPQHSHARKLQLTGDRARVRLMTAINAVDWLRLHLLSE